MESKEPVPEEATTKLWERKDQQFNGKDSKDEEICKCQEGNVEAVMTGLGGGVEKVVVQHYC